MNYPSAISDSFLCPQPVRPASAATGRFFAAVNQQEKVHQRNGTRAADESDACLHPLPAYLDCASLETAIKGITDAVVDKYSRLDNDFDAQSHAQGELPLLSP